MNQINYTDSVGEFLESLNLSTMNFQDIFNPEINERRRLSALENARKAVATKSVDFENTKLTNLVNEVLNYAVENTQSRIFTIDEILNESLSLVVGSIRMNTLDAVNNSLNEDMSMAQEFNGDAKAQGFTHGRAETWHGHGDTAEKISIENLIDEWTSEGKITGKTEDDGETIYIFMDDSELHVTSEDSWYVTDKSGVHESNKFAKLNKLYEASAMKRFKVWYKTTKGQDGKVIVKARDKNHALMIVRNKPNYYGNGAAMEVDDVEESFEPYVLDPTSRIVKDTKTLFQNIDTMNKNELRAYIRAAEDERFNLRNKLDDVRDGGHGGYMPKLLPQEEQRSLRVKILDELEKTIKEIGGNIEMARNQLEKPRYYESKKEPKNIMKELKMNEAKKIEYSLKESYRKFVSETPESHDAYLDYEKPIVVNGVKENSSFKKKFSNYHQYEQWMNKPEAEKLEVHKVVNEWNPPRNAIGRIPTIELTLPARYASALINNDMSSEDLDEQDKIEIQDIIHTYGSAIDVGEGYYGYDEQSGKHGQVADYTFYSNEHPDLHESREKLTREMFIPDNAEEVKDSESSAVVYVYDKERDGVTVPVAMAFAGRKAMPDWHYRFKNVDHRQQMIDRHFETYREREKRKRASMDKPRNVEVGDIFVASWGYDATNVQYYEVTKLVGSKSVEIREIAQDKKETNFMQGTTTPIPGKYVSSPMRRLVRDNAIKITSFAYARKLEKQPDGTYGEQHWSSYH